MINEEESQIGKNLRNAMNTEFGNMASQVGGSEFLTSANNMLKGIQEDEELEEKWSEKYKKSIKICLKNSKAPHSMQIEFLPS